MLYRKRALLLAILVLAVDSQSSPHPQANGLRPNGSSATVTHLCVLDTSHTWLSVFAPAKSYLLRLGGSDGTWQRIPVPHAIGDFFFLNPDQGWAILADPRHAEEQAEPDLSFVLAGTEDGGSSWTRLSKVCTSNRKNSIVLTSLAFADSLNGVIVGAGSAGVPLLFETHDGGHTIRMNRELGAIQGQGLSQVLLTSGGFLVVGNYTVLAKEAGATHWKRLLSKRDISQQFGAIMLTAGAVLSPGSFLLVGGGSKGVVLSSVDSGRTWKAVLETKSMSSLLTISAWDKNHACAAGLSAVLVCTADGGASWTELRSLPQSHGDRTFVDNTFEHLAILPSGSGYALDDLGYLYSTHDFGRHWEGFDLSVMP